MFKKASELKSGDLLVQRYSGYLNDILSIEKFIDRNGENQIRIICDRGCSFVIDADEVVECI